MLFLRKQIVVHHVANNTIFDDRFKYFTYGGCKANRSVIARLMMVSFLKNRYYVCNLPILGKNPFFK